jgi:tetratricopeptide (TPR) repeat protein
MQNKACFSWLLSLSLLCGLSTVMVPTYTRSDFAHAATTEHPLLKQAREEMSDLELKAALVSVNKLLTIQPKNVAALILRAIIRREDNGYNRDDNDKKRALTVSLVLKDLALAQALNPKNPAVYVERAELYKCLGEYKKSLLEIQKAIQIDPKNPEYYLFQASIASSPDLKQYWLGAKGLDKWVALRPQDPDSYYERGAYFQREGLSLSRPTSDGQLPIKADPGILQSQLKDFSKALELNPAYYAALRDRAETYLQLKQYPEALADLNAAIALIPEDSGIKSTLENYLRFKRVEVYFAERNYANILAELQKINALTPSDFDKEQILDWQALSHYWSGQYALAEKDYLAKLKINPQDSDAWLYLLYAQLWQKNFDTVAKTFLQAEKQYCSSCAIPLGHVELLSNHPQKALSLYQTVFSYPLIDQLYAHLIPNKPMGVSALSIIFKDFEQMETLGWSVDNLAQIRSQLQASIP